MRYQLDLNRNTVVSRPCVHVNGGCSRTTEYGRVTIYPEGYECFLTPAAAWDAMETRAARLKDWAGTEAKSRAATLRAIRANRKRAKNGASR